MAGIWLLARVELRRGWRAMALLGVLAGVGLGLTLASAQVARRTTTAYDRLERASGAPDVIVLWTADPRTSPAADLPGVRRHWDAVYTIGRVRTDEQLYLAVVAGERRPPWLDPGLVVRGRAADPEAVDEIVITEALARGVGLDVGDAVPMDFLSADEFARFDTGFGAPDGPRLPLRVVGVVRSVFGAGGNAPGAFGTAAFARRMRAADATYPATFLDLRGGVEGLPDYERRLAATSDRLAPAVGAEEFSAYVTTVPSAQRAGYALTARVLVTGLLVFGGVAGVAALVAAGLALRRQLVLRAATERSTLAALGVDRHQLWWVRILASVPLVVIGTAVAVAGAVGTGHLGPIGSLARLEPRPGFQANVGLLALGATLVGLVLLGVTVAAGVPGNARASRGPRRSSRIVDRLASAGASPPVVIGAGLALTPGRARGGAPLRSAIVATAAVLTALVAVLVFSASLDRLRTSPTRWGWNADFVVYDTNDAAMAELRAQPGVRTVAEMSEFQVRVEDEQMTADTIDRPAVGWTALRGRAPRASGEVMLGARVARRLDRDVGDRVVLRGATGRETSLAVVGVGTAPLLRDGDFGGGVLVARGDVADVALTQEQRSALVAVRRGVSVEHTRRVLAARYELEGTRRPPDVENLSQLGRLPELLAAFLALLAAAVLGHAVATTTRRRRRELDTLRAIGFVRRQAGSVVVIAALVGVSVALVAGIAAGVLVGGAAWRFTAHSAYVAGDLAPWVGPVLVAVLAALLVAVAVSLGPARRASRRPVAEGLRAE